MSPMAQLDVHAPTLASPPTPCHVVYLGAQDLRADPAPLDGWGLELALKAQHRTIQRYRIRVATRYLHRDPDPSSPDRVWHTLADLGARQIEERTTVMPTGIHMHDHETTDLFPLIALARRLALRAEPHDALRPGQTLLKFELPPGPAWHRLDSRLHATVTSPPPIGAHP